MRIRVFLVLFFMFTSGAMAYDAGCVDRAAARFGVPSIIIKAIIEAESGGNPLAVNIEGRAFFPPTQTDAVSLISSNSGRSMDVGLMQVNSFWFKKLNVPQSMGFLECFNINFGTWILSHEIQKHGLNMKAVGKYHSPDMSKGGPYAADILRRMIRILNRG